MSTPGYLEERESDHRQARRSEFGAPTNTAFAIRDAIVTLLEDAHVQVQGAGGHFTIDVVSATFAGKSPLERQRMVYRAIAPLMKGDNAPVHAVDRLNTRVPAVTGL
ncbi:MAG TPA: BolA family protein [Polyangiaceae bacterium]|nr:BolA family protein [Polyangiaceae bacterium]